MLLVPIGNRHLLLVIVVEVFIFTSLDVVLFMHLLETIWCGLVLHEADKIEKMVTQRIRGSFINFIVDDIKGSGLIMETI